MELDHEFTVPVPVDQAWSVLLDVERVALCVPGATLDSADGDEYAGRLKVKVGAMTITYRGTARIAVADRDARTVTIEAAAKEARGSGTAAATVQARLHDEGDSTRVTVHTKLNVTGRPAQFGRNILAEVGAKLISRFAKNLAAELESPSNAEAVDQQGAAEVAQEAVRDRSVVEQAAAVPEAPAEKPVAAVPQQRPASSVESTDESAPESTPEPADKPLRPVTPIRQRQQDDAIDLLEVAGPSLAKRAVPAAATLVALLTVVRYLIRRRRR